MITKKLILKKLAYNTLGNLKIRTQRLDNVLILTSSRSGSTWLNESLQNTKEFKLYNQPFDRVFNASVYDANLPSDKTNPFYSNLNTAEFNQLTNYWFQIINGRINPNTDWRFYLKSYNFFYKRKLIKSFFTKDIVEFYVSQPNLKIIYLIRNPVHRGISNINYGYKDFGDILLRNQILIQSRIIDTEKLKNIYTQTNSLLTKHVIAWYLENFIIYNYINSNTHNHLQILRYEDMVSEKNTERKISNFIFNSHKFKLSEKVSKTSKIKSSYVLSLKLNTEDMTAIKSCLPEFMPYLNELNLSIKK